MKINTYAQEQPITYTNLLKLIDNIEYPFESYEILENLGFSLYESVDYATELQLETSQGIEKVKGCYMTYYSKFDIKTTINIHSCVNDKIIPMSDFNTKRYISFMSKGDSRNYNYLIEKIKQYSNHLKSEPFEPGSQVTKHSYKHKEKSIYFEYYKYLQNDGMVYIINIAL